MEGSFKGRDFLTLQDYTAEELWSLLQLSMELKRDPFKLGKPLQDRYVALIFEKPSLRTRVTFETALYDLGGYPVYLSPQDIGLGKREAIKDVARNLSRWTGLIIARVFEHSKVEELAENASIPVINALSDDEHPCQALTDLYTIWKLKGLKGIKFAYIGDGNNVCHSLMLISQILGIKMTIATPEGFEPKDKYRKVTEHVIINDPLEAAKDADVIYTDVWYSMGQEDEAQKRREVFKKFQINSELLKHAKSNVIVMHCLPAHRGEEITDEVIDGKNSVVYEQAENRLHVQKALIYKMFKG